MKREHFVLKDRVRFTVRVVIALLVAVVWVVTGSPAAAKGKGKQPVGGVDSQTQQQIITFDAGTCGVSNYPKFCEEADKRFESFFPFGAHLHLWDFDGDGDRELLAHGYCCSHPYVITGVDGASFSLRQVDIGRVYGTHTMTPFVGTVAGPTLTFTSANAFTTFTFPPSFGNVTRVVWETPGSGSMIIDNLAQGPGYEPIHPGFWVSDPLFTVSGSPPNLRVIGSYLVGNDTDDPYDPADAIMTVSVRVSIEAKSGKSPYDSVIALNLPAPGPIAGLQTVTIPFDISFQVPQGTTSVRVTVFATEDSQGEVHSGSESLDIADPG